jgi:hypothetical protein
VSTKFDLRNLEKWLDGRLRRCKDNINIDIGGKAKGKETVRKSKT